MELSTAYTLLGVGPDATAAEIRLALDWSRRSVWLTRAEHLALDQAYEVAMAARRRHALAVARASHAGPAPRAPMAGAAAGPLPGHGNGGADSAPADDERAVVRVLAGRWQPGHARLLRDASVRYGWCADPGRLACFGAEGAVLEAAVRQQVMLDADPPAVRAALTALLERLDNPLPPSREALRMFRHAYRRLQQWFPAWRALAIAPDVLARWDAAFDAYPAVDYATYLAGRKPEKAPYRSDVAAAILIGLLASGALAAKLLHHVMSVAGMAA